MPATLKQKRDAFTIARDLLVSVVREPYAWPGGYERLLITVDGGLICSGCVRKEAKRIMADVHDGFNSGWYPVAATYEAVSAEYTKKFDEDLISSCDQCGKEIGECV